MARFSPLQKKNLLQQHRRIPTYFVQPRRRTPPFIHTPTLISPPSFTLPTLPTEVGRSAFLRGLLICSHVIQGSKVNRFLTALFPSGHAPISDVEPGYWWFRRRPPLFQL